MENHGDDAGFVGGTVADASGQFSLTTAPWTYMLLVLKNGFVSKFESAPLIYGRVTDGQESFRYIDAEASGSGRRFYRAVVVSPRGSGESISA